MPGHFEPQKPISRYYILSLKSNTRDPLAETNNLNSESTNFNCQGNCPLFINPLWHCLLIFPFTSLPHCNLLQATERKMNWWTTVCTKIPPVFLFMGGLHVTVNFYRTVYSCLMLNNFSSQNGRIPFVQFAQCLYHCTSIHRYKYMVINGKMKKGI